MSRRQAVRAVQSLIGRGVVEVVRRGGRGVGATTYCVLPGGIEVFRRKDDDSDTGDTKLVTPEAKSGVTGGNHPRRDSVPSRKRSAP